MTLTESEIRASWEAERENIRVFLRKRKFNPKSIEKVIDNYIETMVFAKLPCGSLAGIAAAWDRSVKSHLTKAMTTREPTPVEAIYCQRCGAWIVFSGARELTDENARFCRRLIAEAKAVGWGLDYTEIIDFVQNVHKRYGLPVPTDESLEPPES